MEKSIGPKNITLTEAEYNYLLLKRNQLEKKKNILIKARRNAISASSGSLDEISLISDSYDNEIACYSSRLADIDSIIDVIKLGTVEVDSQKVSDPGVDYEDIVTIIEESKSGEKETFVFQIVNPVIVIDGKDLNASVQLIRIDAPIAMAVFGHQVGEVVTWTDENGKNKSQATIVEIIKSNTLENPNKLR